jgi:hypothetical protein
MGSLHEAEDASVAFAIIGPDEASGVLQAEGRGRFWAEEWGFDRDSRNRRSR